MIALVNGVYSLTNLLTHRSLSSASVFVSLFPCGGVSELRHCPFDQKQQIDWCSCKTKGILGSWRSWRLVSTCAFNWLLSFDCLVSPSPLSVHSNSDLIIDQLTISWHQRIYIYIGTAVKGEIKTRHNKATIKTRQDIGYTISISKWMCHVNQSDISLWKY